MALLVELGRIEAEVSEIRLQLTEPRLGNPKYGMERRELTDRLDALYNRAVRLLHEYIDSLNVLAAVGDWTIQVTHKGDRPERTAVARRGITGASLGAPHMFWFMLHHELSGCVRSILALEGEPIPSDTHESSMSLMQDDMAELLRVLELGDHARPISPHEVMQTEILPEIRALKSGRAVS